MLGLKDLAKTVEWHSSRDQLDYKGGGLFITLPSSLGNLFPDEGRASEDTSPDHITLLYVEGIKDLNEEEKNKILQVSQDVIGSFKAFTIAFDGVDKFDTDDGEAYYSPAKSEELHKLNDALKKAFDTNNLPYSKKFPEFKPHVTIEYVKPGKERKYPEVDPKGAFKVQYVWLWGLEEPHILFLS